MKWITVKANIKTKQTEWHIYGNKRKEHWRGKMDFAGLKCGAAKQC